MPGSVAPDPADGPAGASDPAAGTDPAGGAGSGVGSRSAGSAGGCSTTTWALVPLRPNEDTPARRGRPVSGQGVASVSSATAPAVQSTFGDGRSMCRVRGSSPCPMASTILMMPPTPAAAWVCPMFDFSDPSHTGRSAGRSWP